MQLLLEEASARSPKLALSICFVSEDGSESSTSVDDGKKDVADDYFPSQSDSCSPLPDSKVSPCYDLCSELELEQLQHNLQLPQVDSPYDSSASLALNGTCSGQSPVECDHSIDPDLGLDDQWFDSPSRLSYLSYDEDDWASSSPRLTFPLPASMRSSRQRDAIKPHKPRDLPVLTTTRSESEPISQSPGHFRSPDRFLAPRDCLGEFVDKFRANRDPQTLSPTERIVRCDVDSSDAFQASRQTITTSRAEDTHNMARSSPGSFHRGVGLPTLLGHVTGRTSERQVSAGSTWTVGGIAPSSVGVPDGRGRLVASGTNAPMYASSFAFRTPKPEDDRDRHEDRLARALDFDQRDRIFRFAARHIQAQKTSIAAPMSSTITTKTSWNGAGWAQEGINSMLDAPNLRDDFYCSILAYSPTCHTLAVGLGDLLYAWSEARGVQLICTGASEGTWLTSVGFSSTVGSKAILAYGRSDGTLRLMSLYDQMVPRFEVRQPCPIACVIWRPTVSIRASRNPLQIDVMANVEELLVGDEIGNVYYYSVEWPEAWEVVTNGWCGALSLMARIETHTQQICGLAWSIDGTTFATGGNDNLCCVFQASTITETEGLESGVEEEVIIGFYGVRRPVTSVGHGSVRAISTGLEQQRWIHGAAVKAIAFCPWREGLVATGGGSNDKCIHFFHYFSGAVLATISVAAQVTSLIWSLSRREIVATFGYAQPEHPYRIAVFSWPECKQVAAIPWESEHRALYAIAYPVEPNSVTTQVDHRKGRAHSEGCIVVAASDESVKFHEVWAIGQSKTAGGEGLLGGSDILEGLEGIDKEGEVIR